MDNHYGGVIWTNHALDRLRERGIKQGDAWATWRNPQESRKGTVVGSWVYHRTYGSTQIEVVAKHLPAQAGNKEKWIILSVWSKPVFQGGVKKKTPLWLSLMRLLFK